MADFEFRVGKHCLNPTKLCVMLLPVRHHGYRVLPPIQNHSGGFNQWETKVTLSTLKIRYFIVADFEFRVGIHCLNFTKLCVMFLPVRQHGYRVLPLIQNHSGRFNRWETKVTLSTLKIRYFVVADFEFRVGKHCLNPTKLCVMLLPVRQHGYRVLPPIQNHSGGFNWWETKVTLSMLKSAISLWQILSFG